MPKIGVVVPVYQAEATLDELHRRLVTVLDGLTPDWQVVYVDDGSRDRSWALVEATCADPRVVGLKLIRNFGEHVAITAGLDLVDADHTVIMACDLQDDPAALPSLVAAQRETGADLVLVRRMRRKDPLLKRLLARLFYAVIRFFVRVDYDYRVGNYRCLTRRAVGYFRQHREHLRNVNAIMAIMDLRTTYVDVEHQARAGGRSGYNLYRSSRMAFHVLVGYSEVPLYLVVILGVTIIALTVLAFGWQLAAEPPMDPAVRAIRLATTVLALIGGLIVLAIGTVGVYLTKSFAEAMKRPIYFVETRRN